MPASTVLINKQIAIATFPGEPFVEFQMNWRDRCPVRTATTRRLYERLLRILPDHSGRISRRLWCGQCIYVVGTGAGERIVDRAW